MTDYGHDLEFGLFPTPDAARAHEVLELAALAEVSGFDLVTVQDHPYQARHLDAWTLLSVIAARTSTLRVAPNVANLPLRNPVVLAESVASLDLLSGGRVELGIGAGGFFDPVVAAGGVRLSPGEAVDALEEAIGIIRAMWVGSGSVRLDGVHHRAVGLHSGPAPAHPVGIWVGAYKPRMLRLTGRLADGWLPSAGYAGPEVLGEMNARIDEAALGAGRAPEAVRRLYNVSGSFGSASGFLRGRPADWAEQLAALTLEQGMATYVLGTDDADDVRRFGEEVAPLVRDLVATERERRAVEPPDAVASPAAAVVSERVETRGPEVASAATGSAPNRSVVTPTPDDGTRLTGILPWDEASRPTYPVRPDSQAQAGYTPQQLAVPQHLVEVHDHLRAELTQVRDIVDQVVRGHLAVGSARSAVNAMTMRQNNWTLGAYCESYCRVVTGHHGLEDSAMFPHLRASDPDAVPVIDRLEEEHEVIHDVLDDVDRALVALVADQPGALDHLQHVVDLLTDTLLSHLAYEERELLHPLARHGFYR
jgi:alkanesulfonate monooxygenase SsuD/methylene tetrahydromethanopterin reductase-like flavin-dependent oxidoreductase (luciferase family)/hemerythrin-like domain-containing protein